MDGISFLQPLSPELQEAFYARGHAHGCVALNCKTAATNYHLEGRLYLSKSGWLLLSVPNAFVRGLFSALTAPGAELPTAGLMNVPGVAEDALNAHISVLTAAEVEAIGADKINERGQMFNYGLGPVKEIPVSNVDGINRVWAVQVVSPALAALRKSYGLTPLPHGDHAFHITVACRRKRVLGNNDVSKFDAASGRGELKAAADDKTTYDCCCAGPCSCPPTCICKKSGYCGRIKDAADLLAGGEADNKPDSDFPADKLQEGAEHEREHTDDDQVAKEIAKDHLQTDPAYYTAHKEQKEAINKTPAIILQLRAAKEHSDAKRYDQKNAILRELMLKAPNEWYVDDPLPHHMGVTHDPTKFKFHADPTIIPPDVKVRAKAAEAEPYLAQLKATPVAYNKDESVWRNFVKHLMTVKNRGDNQLQMQANTESWRKTLDPAYRHQQNMALARGEAPKQPGFATQMINRHGGNVLAALS